MTQGMEQLPCEADFRILGWCVKIKNHKVMNHFGLFGSMMDIAKDSHFGSQFLTEFEGNGITCKAAIQHSATELENNPEILAYLTLTHYCFWEIKEDCSENDWDEILNFSKSVEGRNIAGMISEKIKSCTNWQDVYDELRPKSAFNCGMTGEIREAMNG